MAEMKNALDVINIRIAECNSITEEIISELEETATEIFFYCYKMRQKFCCVK